MLIAYNPIFHIKDDNGELFVGVGGPNIMMSLGTDTFDLRVKDGKLDNSLFRNLSADEAHALGMALIEAATALKKSEVEWNANNEVIVDPLETPQKTAEPWEPERDKVEG